MSELQEFQDFAEFSRRCKRRGPKRYLRDHSDPFSKCSPQEFYSLYKFMPWVVKDHIIPLLEPELKRPTKRGLPFAPETMVLITLRFYATGDFQKLGGGMNIPQPSMSRIITQVSVAIARKMKEVVKFPPSAEDIRQVKQKFYEIAEFPEVIGCIGCSHVKIKCPGKGKGSDVYKNKDGWYSVKVQAVAGPDLQFYNLVARWPGSTPDNVIFKSSSLKKSMESGECQGVLLGDSVYPVSNILMTPFQYPNSPGQERYNKSHCKTSTVVEQAFEVWKRRFPCLEVGMQIKLKTVIAVICGCAALHNIAISHDDVISPVHRYNECTPRPPVLLEDTIQDDTTSTGYTAREYIVQNFMDYRALVYSCCFILTI